MLLDPVKVTQPTSVDIYPGRSGRWALPAADWNNFVLTAPNADQTRALYNQGREDALAWVRVTFTGANSFTNALLVAANTTTLWK
jgi:hypothetical protein